MSFKSVIPQFSYLRNNCNPHSEGRGSRHRFLYNTFIGAEVPVSDDQNTAMCLQPSGAYADLDTFLGPF